GSAAWWWRTWSPPGDRCGKPWRWLARPAPSWWAWRSWPTAAAGGRWTWACRWNIWFPWTPPVGSRTPAPCAGRACRWSSGGAVPWDEPFGERPGRIWPHRAAAPLPAGAAGARRRHRRRRGGDAGPAGLVHVVHH